MRITKMKQLAMTVVWLLVVAVIGLVAESSGHRVADSGAPHLARGRR